MTFKFINEFMNSKVNNGFLRFNSVSNANEAIKKQLAHIFGDLLRKEFDPIRGEIKDILSEITTLRHSLITTQDESRKFLYGFRYLLEHEAKFLSDLIERVSGSLEEGVPVAMKSKDIKEFLANEKMEVVVDDSTAKYRNQDIKGDDFDWLEEGVWYVAHYEMPYSNVRRKKINKKAFSDIVPINEGDPSAILIVETKKVIVNRNAEQYLNAIFDKFKAKSVQ